MIPDLSLYAKSSELESLKLAISSSCKTKVVYDQTFSYEKSGNMGSATYIELPAPNPPQFDSTYIHRGVLSDITLTLTLPDGMPEYTRPVYMTASLGEAGISTNIQFSSENGGLPSGSSATKNFGSYVWVSPSSEGAPSFNTYLQLSTKVSPSIDWYIKYSCHVRVVQLEF